MKRISIIFIVSLIILSTLTLNCFAANTGEHKTITATVTTSNKDYAGEAMTFIVPDNVSANNGHLIVCWSGTYQKVALYVAKEWTENTVFMLSQNYTYLYAYDTNLKKYYDFDVYTYSSLSSVPVYDSTVGYLFWNGLIYENSGLPNILINTEPVYFSNLALCNVASQDISFFPQTLLEATLHLMEMEVPAVGQRVVGTMKTLVLCGVGCLALLVGLVTFFKVSRRFHLR